MTSRSSGITNTMGAVCNVRSEGSGSVAAVGCLLGVDAKSAAVDSMCLVGSEEKCVRKREKGQEAHSNIFLFPWTGWFV